MTFKPTTKKGSRMTLKWVKNLAITALFCLSSTSFAGVITDVKTVNQTLNTWQSVTWTHDINDNGFTLGTAASASVKIELFDDSRNDGLEFATIILGVFDFQDGAWIYNPVSTWVGSLGLSSMAILNASGLLEVTVASLMGDFNIGKSILTVNTINKTVSVPESSSIALLMIGFLGLVLARRKIRNV
jgi:hypothetical protein